jgi:branched-chain amino acid transport system substrate-binding protein
MDVETFYGPVNFDETGKNAAKPMGFIQIQDGEIRLVGPAEVADAELQYPLGE